MITMNRFGSHPGSVLKVNSQVKFRPNGATKAFDIVIIIYFCGFGNLLWLIR